MIWDTFIPWSQNRSPLGPGLRMTETPSPAHREGHGTERPLPAPPQRDERNPPSNRTELNNAQ